jgi:hypothetical protein
VGPRAGLDVLEKRKICMNCNNEVLVMKAQNDPSTISNPIMSFNNEISN